MVPDIVSTSDRRCFDRRGPATPEQGVTLGETAKGDNAERFEGMRQAVEEGVGGDQRRVVGLAQALDASEHVEIAADRREVDPVAAADIAVGDLPT